MGPPLTIPDPKELLIQENGHSMEVVDEKKKLPKIDIWKKRTVGEAFDAALQRYHEREALREQ